MLTFYGFSDHTFNESIRLMLDDHTDIMPQLEQTQADMAHSARQVNVSVLLFLLVLQDSVQLI